MKKLFSQLFANKPSEERERLAIPGVPAAGQIYSFKTQPYSEFAPPTTGRYAAIKVLDVGASHVAIGVLEGIWSEPPTLKAVRGASIINKHHLSNDGRPASFGVQHAWWKLENDLDEVSYLGVLAVSARERSLANAIANFAPGSSFSTLHSANYTAEGEWRWANDRSAFVEEIELRNARNEADRAAKEKRYRERLSKLTWDQLLSETPFARWSPSPPYPSAEFTEAARNVILKACEELKELGPKPAKKLVRAILKKTVIWFNEEDERSGGVIETEEREDIFAVLEEMAHVARQKSLVDEIDEWREW